MNVRTRTVALLLAAAGAGTLATVATPVLGAAGAAPVSTLQAKVAADGTLLGGNGAASVDVLGPGRYEVTFTEDVKGCEYQATTVNASSQATQAFVAGGHRGANGVYVETKNQGGGLSAAGFGLVVTCDAATTPFAVVGYAGDLVRGTAGTTVRLLGPGRYAVQFPTTVTSCMTLATVGDPGNGVVVDPSGVSTGVGSTTRTVYVETKNPGGGLQDRVPFHLVAICPGTPAVSAVAVPADGIALRSLGDALSYRSGSGRFTVVTRSDVSDCAVVATRGSLNRAVPAVPTTVESATPPALNTVSLQVRQLLAGGGAYTNQSFTAAIVC